jgi:hypothetical protein
MMPQRRPPLAIAVRQSRLSLRHPHGAETLRLQKRRSDRHVPDILLKLQPFPNPPSFRQFGPSDCLVEARDIAQRKNPSDSTQDYKKQYCARHTD